MKNTRKKLSARVIQVMGKEKNVSMHLIDRILKETAVDILSKVCDNVEDRRVRWTTYIDNWARDLEDLGFAVRNELEELYIPEEQLARILNLDESCLSMDGSNGQRGVCLDITGLSFNKYGDGPTGSSPNSDVRT